MKAVTEPLTTLSFVKGADIVPETFSPTALAESETLLEGLASGEAPSIDFSTGGVVNELYIRPWAIGYLSSRTLLEAFRNTMTIEGLEKHPELADDETVNALLSNYLVRLEAGRKSTGQIRVIVTERRVTRISVNSTFTTPSGVVFVTTEAVTVSKTESPTGPSFRPEPNSDGLWYFLVDVEALEPGTSGNIPSGVEMTTGFTIQELVRCVSDAPFSGGKDGESLSAIKSRILEGLSARNMVSQSSMESVIRDNFEGLAGVSALGMDSLLCTRAINPYTGVATGGIVDLYVRMSETPSTFIVTKTSTYDPDNSLHTVVIERDDCPGHTDVMSVRPSGGSVVGTYEIESYTREILPDIEDPGTGATIRPNRIRGVESGANSRWQQTTIIFSIPGSTGDEEVDVELLYTPYVKEIQDIMSSPLNRVVGTDTLVKAFAPCLVTIPSVRIVSDGTVDSQVLVSNVTKTIADTVNQNPQGEPLRVASIVKAVSLVGGVKNVELPITIEGTVTGLNATYQSKSYKSRSSLQVPYDKDLSTGPSNVAFYCSQDSVGVTIS